MRADGLRPLQIWVPDTSAPGFDAAVRRQCKRIVGAENTPETREELAVWETLAGEVWDSPE
jgi:hypothetical protein